MVVFSKIAKTPELRRNEGVKKAEDIFTGTKMVKRQTRARRKWCAAATFLLALVLAFAPAAGSIMRAYAEEEEMTE